MISAFPSFSIFNDNHRNIILKKVDVYLDNELFIQFRQTKKLSLIRIQIIMIVSV